ncbi:MAG: hypothetical protein QP950_09975 [Staphylococcus warneri]|uniref:Phage protein n=1 Tax=Staphylococcus warneri TaxID=1292 RepID=A0A8B2ZIV9_STAWA|nr:MULTISPECIES: hypothetical protein [Staphylococcus]PAK73058.1 hypothetical protein B8W95_07215 [Staphylococcus pasteuri]DAW86975.1 MAG TPA: hypothetical protein [Bacteriophage sp.]EGG96113.1 conserved domain protein [Staphylococcus warneri VCU121]KKI61046.1 hypothetical protein UF68_2237 [Staphylococcus warneri]KTW21116.1 hypothetical protein SA10R_10410 [Staphylococcus warneri]
MDRKDELYKKVIAGLIAGTDEDGNVIITDEDWENVDRIGEEINAQVEKENRKEKLRDTQSIQEYARLNRVTNSERSKNIHQQNIDGMSLREIARKNRVVN